MTDNIKVQNIHETVVSGDEILPIVRHLEQSLIGCPVGHGIIALLSMAFILMKPDVDPDDLERAVTDTSRYMCLLLDKPEDGQKIVMN